MLKNELANRSVYIIDTKKMRKTVHKVGWDGMDAVVERGEDNCGQSRCSSTKFTFYKHVANYKTFNSYDIPSH